MLGSDTTTACLQEWTPGCSKACCSRLVKANVDLKDAWGQTPLLLASKNGHQAVVRLLLETGKANANLEDIGGQTPLLLASRMDMRL